MKKQDRWNEILNIVKQQQEVSVEKLMGVFNVSAATIRRDLLEMEENGTVPEEKAENLLSYYERSNVDVQILVFDNETGEFLGEVTY